MKALSFKVKSIFRRFFIFKTFIYLNAVICKTKLEVGFLTVFLIYDVGLSTSCYENAF